MLVAGVDAIGIMIFAIVLDVPLVSAIGVLVFLGALLDAPGSTARNALVPELAEMAQMPIERATSLIHIIERGARLVGAPLGGLLIALVGTENVLWLDAASFFISAGIVAVTIRGHQLVQVQESAAGSRYFDELQEGLKFIFQDKLLLAIVIMYIGYGLVSRVASIFWRRSDATETKVEVSRS